MKGRLNDASSGFQALALREPIVAHGATTKETPHMVGIAADHGGFELKQYLIENLRKADYPVLDFGNRSLDPDDDYPDFIVPLARAVARGDVSRGVAICGSGAGACVAANKVAGVRACLLHDTFSAHQSVAQSVRGPAAGANAARVVTTPGRIQPAHDAENMAKMEATVNAKPLTQRFSGFADLNEAPTEISICMETDE